MPYSEAAKRATIKYQKENLEQLVIRLKKGDRQRIRDHVALTGENMTTFLNRAIFDTIEKDREKIKEKLSER